VAILDTPNDGPCPCTVSRRGFSYLGSEFGKVVIRGVESVQALDLRPDCNLQQFRRGKVPLLQLGIETIGEVDLNSRHAHNSTPIYATDQAQAEKLGDVESIAIAALNDVAVKLTAVKGRPHRAVLACLLAAPEGFEPPTLSLEGTCSIQLS